MFFLWFTDAPAAIRSLEVLDVSKNAATLQWQSPRMAGRLQGYFVERRQGFGGRWLRVNKRPITDTIFTVKDLTENTEYEFRIVVESETGLATASEPTGVVVPKSPYGMYPHMGLFFIWIMSQLQLNTLKSLSIYSSGTQVTIW